ncbi:MAG: GAF domain-containing protein, partial [Myxococcota bacterium]
MTDDRPDVLLQSLAEEARAVAAAPMAFVSVVSGYTHFFRGWSGLPTSLPTAHVHELCDAVGQWLGRDQRPWFVEDLDASTGELPHDGFRSLGVRSWLGHPIYVGGTLVGALCVLDHEPRAWPQSAWE